MEGFRENRAEIAGGKTGLRAGKKAERSKTPRMKLRAKRFASFYIVQNGFSEAAADTLTSLVRKADRLYELSCRRQEAGKESERSRRDAAWEQLRISIYLSQTETYLFFSHGARLIGFSQMEGGGT